MKDYDNHDMRTGLPALITAPTLSRAELLKRAEELTLKFEPLGIWLDFNPEIGLTDAGLETAISMEHERTRRPGHPSTWEAGYWYAKDDKHAVTVLINKVAKAMDTARELGIEIKVTGKAYHEQI